MTSRGWMGVLGAASVCFAIGCDKGEGLVLTRFLSIDSAQMCVVDAASKVTISRGVLDVGLVPAVGRGYIASPVAQNNLVDHSGTTVSNADAIEVTGVNVELVPAPELQAAIPEALRTFSVPHAGTLLTAGGGSGADGSSAPLVVEIIPAQLAAALADAVPGGVVPHPVVIAKLSAIGRHGDDDIVGQMTEFPVEICKFCLTPPPAACPTDGIPAANVEMGGCFPQQDQAVTCCGSGSELLCGSKVPTK